MDKSQVLNHWKYFLSLEKDFINLRNYLEINEDNFDTYSFEISKLLQLSCSEIDSVCRLMCKIIDSTNDYYDETVFSGKIDLYKKTITVNYPKLIETEIYIPDLMKNIKPWQDWHIKNSPDWWTSYNKVKHYRHSCFEQANLRNAIQALSALMVLDLYLYRIVDGNKYANPTPPSNYFESSYCSPALFARANDELPDF